MREIIIISGKGGTGKTSLTGAFAHLAANKIICDLDVDAPDLHLLLQPTKEREEEFYSGHEAEIDAEKCDRVRSLCLPVPVRGNPEERGRFCGRSPAVRRLQGLCGILPGCGHRVPRETLRPMVRLSHPLRPPGPCAALSGRRRTPGRLVMVLKQQARELAKARGADLVLCDGAPGIGCPVISSLSGAHLAVAVTEPTPSGRHDLERVAELCRHFQTALAVIINKYDLNPEETARIEVFCHNESYPVLARLPHDPLITTAMVQGLVVTELPETDFGRELGQAWTGSRPWPAWA